MYCSCSSYACFLFLPFCLTFNFPQCMLTENNTVLSLLLVSRHQGKK